MWKKQIEKARKSKNDGNYDLLENPQCLISLNKKCYTNECKTIQTLSISYQTLYAQILHIPHGNSTFPQLTMARQNPIRVLCVQYSRQRTNIARPCTISRVTSDIRNRILYIYMYIYVCIFCSPSRSCAQCSTPRASTLIIMPNNVPLFENKRLYCVILIRPRECSQRFVVGGVPRIYRVSHSHK